MTSLLPCEQFLTGARLLGAQAAISGPPPATEALTLEAWLYLGHPAARVYLSTATSTTDSLQLVSEEVGDAYGNPVGQYCTPTSPTRTPR